MAGPSIMSSEVNYSDVQGLVRYGYGWMKEASYFLMRVKDVEAARSWLRSAPIASAVKPLPSPSTAMQVAFTAPGLQALGVSDSIINGFSHEFVSGMAEPSRSRRLGDVENNAPSNWEWGGCPSGAECTNDPKAKEKMPHLLVMFFAKEGLLKDFVQSSTGDAWNAAFAKVCHLETSSLDGIEPFGFADGISQPEIDWRQRRVSIPRLPIFKFQSLFGFQRDYTNTAALGEFLLGYRNEYGKYTDRPLVDVDAASAGLLPAEDAPEKRDVGKNGTYLVMRQLHQDVRRFWQSLSEHAGGDPAAVEKLAAAMVGRTKNGEPLVPIQEKPIPGIEPDERQNHFTYDGDPEGVRCPFGAHIRRANPRNTDFPGRPTGLLSKIITMLGFGPKGFRDDLMSSVRYHRLLRRGREYGPCIPPARALELPSQGEPESGLHFICLNANILRQFEFLQNAWIASTKFSGLTGESDPLLGNREAIPGCAVTSDFNMPQDGRLRRRITGLQQFVTVRGGAYFFLPSIRVLRYFAGAKTP
jgi:Dyp-type peroxidase family